MDQYGTALGFEEEEEDMSEGRPMLSFQEDEQVLITEDNSGSARISFRKNTVIEEDQDDVDLQDEVEKIPNNRTENDNKTINKESNGATNYLEDFDL